jgi:Uma2 family endonuclease
VSPDLADRLRRWFGSRPDILVLNDVQHRLDPGFPNPSPDVSVIQGARRPDRDLASFDVVKQGAVPRLIVEVISPRDRRIRDVDEIDKVALYQRRGVPEYLLVVLPRRSPEPYRISGYRLDPTGVYQPIVPDEQGRLLSETTGLWFAVSQKGDGVVIRDAATGELLRTSKEEEQERKVEAQARQAAEARAAREAEARQAAEAELARLRAEIEHLRRR